MRHVGSEDAGTEVCGQPAGAGECKEMDSPLGPLGVRQPCRHPETLTPAER